MGLKGHRLLHPHKEAEWDSGVAVFFILILGASKASGEEGFDAGPVKAHSKGRAKGAGDEQLQ